MCLSAVARIAQVYLRRANTTLTGAFNTGVFQVQLRACRVAAAALTPAWAWSWLRLRCSNSSTEIARRLHNARNAAARLLARVNWLRMRARLGPGKLPRWAL